jgi:hypothetical protein
MFRLIRGLIGLAVIGGVVYVAVAVPLGQKTLWQHVKAIADSSESKELVKEVKKKAGELTATAPDKGSSPDTRASRRGAAEGKGAGTAEEGGPSAPSDDFSADERRKLRKLIRQKMARDSAASKSSR